MNMKAIKKINRKGISTLVSTVLLIVFVVSLGLVVVNWSGKLVEKGVDQSKVKIGTNLECADVNVKLEEKPGAPLTIIIKNNNRNELDLAGFITRFFISDETVVVDYANEDTEIKSFSAKVFDFSKHQTKKSDGSEGSIVNWDGKYRVEVIPRVDIGSETVNCDTKKIAWEK